MRMKVKAIRNTTLMMALLMVFSSRGFVSCVYGGVLQPTPISQDESIDLSQQESLTYSQVANVSAGDDEADRTLVTAFAVIGILVLIAALVAASEKNKDKNN